MKRPWRSVAAGAAIVGLPVGWWVYNDVHDVPVAGTWTVLSVSEMEPRSGVDVDSFSGLWIRFPSNDGGDYVTFNGCYRSGGSYSAGFGDHFTVTGSNEAGFGCQSGDFDWDHVLADAQHVERDDVRLVIEDGDHRPLLELVPRAVGD